MALQVLLMERKPLVRVATEQMLSLCNAKVIAVGDAELALDALGMFTFDVVIAGIAPGDNSLPRFVNAAKSFQPSLGIVVGEAYCAHTRQPGVVDAYVSFPCTLSALHLAVQQAADAARVAANELWPASVFR